ncbi:hypothetical protein PVAND_011666 [Polypedilum vanderplanki]|uniref:Protein tincar n=1 Tax=Polypedilum vanderplanki TaxID=319348 RepID=A0A9J6CJA6_POLVA|nr:hypothetical protein PVAND_011666 [Polypedilum vanderplanki]
MSLNDTLDYCNKSNDSFLDTTDCSLPNNISNISTVSTGCPSNSKAITTQQHTDNRRKSKIHFNRLWSVWYGILVTFFQGYLIFLGLQKYLGCSLLKWKNGLPATELNMLLIFLGLTVLFLPLFLASALFKIGNLANDGIKLSARKGTCSSEEPVFIDDDGNNSTMKNLWIHGVPISVFIHIITALCLLLPHLLLEAKLIQNQHLPKDNIWKSEIDFLLNRNDRLVILSFINTSPYKNETTSSNNVHNQKYDEENSIEALDYDLNPFETHENLKSFNTATETYQPPTSYDSQSNIRISTYADEDYEIFMPEITTILHTTTTLPSSTFRSTLPQTTTKTTVTTQTPSNIITSTIPSSTAVNTVKINNIHILTTEKENIETTLPTSTTMKTTTISTSPSTIPTVSTTPLLGTTTTFWPTLSYFGFSTEKNHHSGRGGKNHGKNRKHNHKKHHRQHPPIREIDDIPDDPSLEFRPDREFESDLIDRKIHMADNTSKRKIQKINNSGNKSSQEQIKAASKNIDQLDRPRTTQKTRKDSEIHKIVGPSLESSLSTTNPNSKNYDLKAKSTDVSTRKIIEKRSIIDSDDEILEDEDVLLLDSALPSINEDVFIIKESKGDVLYPEALIGAVPNFTQSNQLEGFGGFLQSILGTDDNKFDPKYWFQKSPSLEYLNLALALLIWSVRYPSVFWESSKAFTMVFSLQMIINTIDILLLHVGTSILFKLQIVGQFMTVQNQPSPLLLNGIVTLALTLLAYVLIIASSMILYLYGHSRLTAKIRDCQMITLKDGDLWSYFSHCASLCFIFGISVVKAPIIHDLCVVYRISLDKTVFTSTMMTIVHIFLWVVIWMSLTAKRKWEFKLPLVESIYQTRAEAIQQPLLAQNGRQCGIQKKDKEEGEETIYWPSSPKLKVTFTDEIKASTLTDRTLIPDIIDGKRPILSSIRTNNNSGEADEGEYATLKTTQVHVSEYDEVVNLHRINKNNNDNGCDDASEEGYLCEYVHDESVTYVSTRDLEPPQPKTDIMYCEYVSTARHDIISPMAPVTVQVHSEHLTSTTPRFIRRGDSGMPPTNEALTPKSDTNSTESSTSPPERALSESSSGVHSAEENKDEVVIRSKMGIQKNVKTPAVIQEEPYGRITNNHKMSSFNINSNNVGSSSNTLPHNRSGGISNEEYPVIDYSQCNTMPLMPGAHQIHRMSANNDSSMQRTTLPNNIRYSSAGNFKRQLQNVDSPYATGLGSGHHTFSSRLIQNEPLPAPPIQQSHSNQQQSISAQSSSIYQPVNHFSSSSFSGVNHKNSIQNPYQMVVNELCANNQASFPPPPPPLNTIPMH